MGHSARPDHNLFRIGSFSINLRECTITSDSAAVSVSPKAMQVLECLMDAGTTSVSRDDFIKRVWDDNYSVGDHGLRDAIWELRRAFADDPKAPRVIQTLPRKGYRLLIEASVETHWRYKPGVMLGMLLLSAALFALVITLQEDEASQFTSPWYGPVPVISADGESAALIHSEQGQSDLFVLKGPFETLGQDLKSMTGTLPPDVIKITHSDAVKLSPVWAPNQSDLAFMEYSPLEKGCRVKVYWSARQTLETVAEDCYIVTSSIAQLPSQLAWTKDGDYLAYQARRGEQASVISVINLYDKNGPDITIGAGNDIAAFPQFSDENRLAYLRLNDPMMGYAQVVVLNESGHLDLSCVAMPVWGLTWGDSRHIAMTASMNNPFDLWLLDTHTAQVVPTRTGARHVSAGLVNNELIVDRFSFASPLHITGVINESLPQTLPINGSARAVDYTAVTSDLIITELDDNGQRHLVLTSLSGERQRLFSALEIYNPRFTRDGTAIGFSARNSTQENARAYRLQLDSGEVTPLSGDNQVRFFAEWAADGKGWYGLSGVPSPLRHSASLLRLDENGGVLSTLAAGVSLNVVLDHRGALWWSNDAGVVYRVSPLASEPVAVTWLNSVYESWTIDDEGRMLYYTETGLDGTDIMARDTTGGETQVIRSLANRVDPIVGLTLTRDATLVYRPGNHNWQNRERYSFDTLIANVDPDSWMDGICRRHTPGP